MSMSKTAVLEGYPVQLRRFAEVLRSVDPALADAPSRCEGWTVRSVGSHVVGQLCELVNGRFDVFGSPERQQEILDQRAERSLAELAEELDELIPSVTALVEAFDETAWDGPAPVDLVPTLGDGVEAIWYDAYVHEDDVLAAAGLPPAEDPLSRNATVSHLAFLLDAKGWGPATLALDGCEKYPIGDGGDAIHGDPHAFMLAATGRADASTIGQGPDINVYAP